MGLMALARREQMAATRMGRTEDYRSPVPRERQAYKAWEIYERDPWLTGLQLTTGSGGDAIELWLPWKYRIYDVRHALARTLYASTGSLKEVTLHLQPSSPPLSCLMLVSQVEELSAGKELSLIHI